MALELRRRRFTVDEYYQMTQAGFLGEDDSVELLDGEIVEMTPIGRRYAACVYRLTDLFSQMFRDSALVGVQSPVRLNEKTEPQPDALLLRRRPDFYASGHPTPQDVLLLVEAADSSNEPDRRVKVPLSARSGIPKVWPVDLEQGTITVYRDPASNGYRTARVLRRGEQVSPNAFPDRSIAVDDILPK